MAPTRLEKLIGAQQSCLAVIQLCDTKLRDQAADLLIEGTVRVHLETLVNARQEARLADGEIRALINDDHTYLTNNLFGRIQSAYLDAYGYLQGLNILGNRYSMQSALTERVRSPRSEPDVLVKLPKIDLPVFSGCLDEWESFRDAFSSLIDSRPGLSDSSKFHYLKSCLTGEAAEHVKDVATTNADYAEVWKRLQNRYDNPRARGHKLIDSLVGMIPLKKPTASTMREFVDKIRRAIWSLEKMDNVIVYRDLMIVHLLSLKLDSDTRMLWETYASDRDEKLLQRAVAEKTDVSVKDRIPPFNEFLNFIEKRAQTLSMYSDSLSKEKPDIVKRGAAKSEKRVHVGIKQKECRLCKENHGIWACPTLKAQAVTDSFAAIRKLHLCYNCLGDHYGSQCASTFRCKHSSRKHHTLLHNEDLVNWRTTRSLAKKKERSKAKVTPSTSTVLSPPNTSATTVATIETPSSAVHMHYAHRSSSQLTTILATACLQVANTKGKGVKARVLLDQGSESSFISESLANLLHLPRRSVMVPLIGVGDNRFATARGIVCVNINPISDRNFNIQVEAYVLPRLTGDLPTQTIVGLNMESLIGFTLADPSFGRSGPIDMILGADVYGQLLRPGLKQIPGTQLTAQNTALGWIVSGRSNTDLESGVSRRAEGELSNPLRALHCSADIELSDALQRFWAIEETSTSPIALKPEDEKCERLFAETHTRDGLGRFVVKLPLREEPPRAASETHRMALGSLRHLQQKLARDHDLRNDYCKFIAEYEQLGHMERIPREQVFSTRAWYLPHHAVRSTSGKLRVVFDASRKLQSNHCLNDFLMPGPPLQSELPLILTNWRQYEVVFTSDIVKMFRQIRLAEGDRELHRIVWSEHAEAEPIIFRLNTVTYGTSCAPYLAIRTLQQLANDGQSQYPLGAATLKHSIYVDDVFEGGHTLELAQAKERELIDLLKTACIELGKWAANRPELLPRDMTTDGSIPDKRINYNQTIKTLGILWNSKEDTFGFTAHVVNQKDNCWTKRLVLSSIARLFDPLSWLAPLTVVAKILMQDLCLGNLDWDTPLDNIFLARWTEYCQSLSTIHEIKVERWLGTTPETKMQLHGFCDASKRAYSACVYLRKQGAEGISSVDLLAAKTKVSPLKTKSIPNLELCGAILAVQLVKQLQKLAWLEGLEVFLWSDNENVLSWLNKHPSHWKTFVANRVSLIQTELPSAAWSHVLTGDNPADIATRGAHSRELRKQKLWWHGPPWLLNESEHWPRFKRNLNVLSTQVATIGEEWFRQHSSFTTLVKMSALWIRWLYRATKRKAGLPVPSMHIFVEDMHNARALIFRLVQARVYKTEIAILKKGEPLPVTNKLAGLAPFIDERDGLLRVGGRLNNAPLHYERKHPPILPRDSFVSCLLVRQAHQRTLHGGPTLTSSMLLQQAWIPTSRRLVKSELKMCVPCQRARPKLVKQLMGDLPHSRLYPERPFTVTGLDYAGPFQIRASSGRGQRSTKGYIALFVCFATKALHLELVSNLTTEAFLAAYRRFVSRRGLCRKLYSDNATTYKGADKELKAMYKTASKFYKDICVTLRNDGTDWTFISPNTPHYGGLWEAGVRSVKHHLKRIIGCHRLNFEEFTTLLTEIETCLNSHPLRPLSADPDDLQALTPSHFLIGSSSGLVPEAESTTESMNQLRRYQLTARLRNQLWKRWSSEYMNHLQERSKWRGITENFKIGQLVLIKDDRYPASKWPLGRVLETHPGADGVARVVTVKTSTNELKRHIARLVPLYITEESSTPVSDNANE